MRDPYSVLGVRRNAGPDEIKAAWRSVAKAVHPDQNRDDPNATQRFAEAGRAYELLKNPGLRSRYDHARREAELRRMEEMKRKRSGETEATIDPETAEDMISRLFGADGRARQRDGKADAPQPETRSPERKTAAGSSSDAGSKDLGAKAETRGPQKPEDAAAGDADAATPEPSTGRAPLFPRFPRAAAPAADLISAMVQRIRGNSAKPAADKVPDIFCSVTVTIGMILRREKATATLPDGQTLKVALPAGTTDGTMIRLKDMGYRLNGMLRGDVVVAVAIAPDAAFRTDGCDVRTPLSISIQDAVLGCTATVPTPEGSVKVTVPAWSGSDHVVRLEGQGLPTADGRRGDLLVELRLMLSEKPDNGVIDLMRSRANGFVL